MKEKTYKREFGTALVAVLIGFFIGGAYSEYFYDVAELLLTPVMLFAGAAFGLDSYAKQVQR